MNTCEGADDEIEWFLCLSVDRMAVCELLA